MSDQQPNNGSGREATRSDWNRREFLKTAGVAGTVAAVGSVPNWAQAKAASSDPESVVKKLYQALSDEQRNEICFDWDYIDPERGLLRTRVSNNWNITKEEVNKKFFSDEQRTLIREIFEGIYNPEWHARIDKQLEDDAGGWGEGQSIAIFGDPESDQFEFVMTGRHMTVRCDGNSTDHVAFGGPIFYGHAAEDFNESADHVGNVFWPQAVEANKLYQMLDGKQRKLALVKRLPHEDQVAFKGPSAAIAGIPISELTADQKQHAQHVLQMLIEPYRQSDQDEAVACLKAQGGLDACSLAFYSKGDIGDDGVWDNWRLEGPSFVWHYRGAPHVHVWVNVADDPSVKLNAEG